MLRQLILFLPYRGSHLTKYMDINPVEVRTLCENSLVLTLRGFFPPQGVTSYLVEGIEHPQGTKEHPLKLLLGHRIRVFTTWQGGHVRSTSVKVRNSFCRASLEEMYVRFCWCGTVTTWQRAQKKCMEVIMWNITERQTGSKRRNKKLSLFWYSSKIGHVFFKSYCSNAKTNAEWCAQK